MTDYEKKHEKDLELIKKFRLLDDDFLTRVFADLECAEFLLQIILENKGLRVMKVHTQHAIKNLHGRSVRLDIFAIDQNNKVHNVEVQRSDKGAGARRARYNISLMDGDIIDPGEEFEMLPESYVIFITEKDVLKRNLPIYHIDRIIKETGEIFKDGAHIIYVNAKITDDTELGRLMHDFWCTDPNDMLCEPLVKRVRYFKEDEEGVSAMCRMIEEVRAEAAAEARTQERLNEKRNTVIRAYQNGYSISESAKLTEVTEQQVKTWINEAGLLN